jgi:hypothetical protein
MGDSWTDGRSPNARRLVGVRTLVRQEGEQRVFSQGVVIVEVLVAQGNPEDPMS